MDRRGIENSQQKLARDTMDLLVRQVKEGTEKGLPLNRIIENLDGDPRNFEHNKYVIAAIAVFRENLPEIPRFFEGYRNEDIEILKQFFHSVKSRPTTFINERPLDSLYVNNEDRLIERDSGAQQRVSNTNQNVVTQNEYVQNTCSGYPILENLSPPIRMTVASQLFGIPHYYEPVEAVEANLTNYKSGYLKIVGTLNPKEHLYGLNTVGDKSYQLMLKDVGKLGCFGFYLLTLVDDSFGWEVGKAHEVVGGKFCEFKEKPNEEKYFRKKLKMVYNESTDTNTCVFIPKQPGYPKEDGSRKNSTKNSPIYYSYIFHFLGRFHIIASFVFLKYQQNIKMVTNKDDDGKKYAILAYAYGLPKKRKIERPDEERASKKFKINDDEEEEEEVEGEYDEEEEDEDDEEEDEEEEDEEEEEMFRPRHYLHRMAEQQRTMNGRDNPPPPPPPRRNQPIDQQQQMYYIVPPPQPPPVLTFENINDGLMAPVGRNNDLFGENNFIFEENEEEEETVLQ